MKRTPELTRLLQARSDLTKETKRDFSTWGYFRHDPQCLYAHNYAARLRLEGSGVVYEMRQDDGAYRSRPWHW
jgi:hypothetical protein